MVFRSKVNRSPKNAAKVAPEPIPERKRTAETVARKAQHSFISADTTVTGDLEGVGDRGPRARRPRGCEAAALGRSL